MPTSNQTFDSHLETWKREQTMPWQRVRRKVEISNLLRHVGQSLLRILDAGGGNGYPSIPFAQNGCQVVVADYSEAMITDGQNLMSELGLAGHTHSLVKGGFNPCHFRKRNASSVATIFPH